MKNLNLIQGNFGNPKQTLLDNIQTFIPNQVDFFDIDCFSLNLKNEYFKNIFNYI